MSLFGVCSQKVPDHGSPLLHLNHGTKDFWSTWSKFMVSIQHSQALSVILSSIASLSGNRARAWGRRLAIRSPTTTDQLRYTASWVISIKTLPSAVNFCQVGHSYSMACDQNVPVAVGERLPARVDNQSKVKGGNSKWTTTTLTSPNRQYLCEVLPWHYSTSSTGRAMVSSIKTSQTNSFK